MAWPSPITDIFSLLLERVGLPLWQTFMGLFDLNGRLGAPYLLISLAVAYALYRQQRRQAGSQGKTFGAFLGGRAVWLHRSALVDYQYYFVRVLLHLAFIAPILAWLAPVRLQDGEVSAWLDALWGLRPRLDETLPLMLLYGLGVFLLSDLVHYWLHRAFHGRWLWEFHKVHHSAIVMVPPTASRIHVVEKLAEHLAKGTVLALYGGAFFHACGGEIDKFTLFGVSYLVLLFNSLAANLRHTHVWLSFGPRIEHLLNSPAQHQIHHSADPRHFNRNFGTNLSLWDWLFGTLYVTTPEPEPLTFGVGPRDGERYTRLHNLILRPFWVTALKLWRARPLAGKPATLARPRR